MFFFKLNFRFTTKQKQIEFRAHQRTTFSDRTLKVNARAFLWRGCCLKCSSHAASRSHPAAAKGSCLWHLRYPSPQPWCVASAETNPSCWAWNCCRAYFRRKLLVIVYQAGGDMWGSCVSSRNEFPENREKWKNNKWQRGIFPPPFYRMTSPCI